ncbi:MAG: ATP-binding protein [Campylobacteraceae bacterium]|jgi:hypothetical protein|nr:ATP-binding protein [Campylobacteraceae bacterium]
MKVKLSKAAKMFFGNSSLEMVYFEAIANALDAGADEIKIVIHMEDYAKPATLSISIEDNGIGFTDEKFDKFDKLFDTDEASHKGIGRLAYLCYFNKILIESNYNKYYRRTFEFSDNFDGESNITNVEESKSGTKLFMSEYALAKLGKYGFVQPRLLKEKIIDKFYSRLYKFKQTGQHITISISTTIDNKSATEILSTDEISELEPAEIHYPFDLSEAEFYYKIDEAPMEKGKTITAISIDNRTYSVDIIAEENLPTGYNMVFLLFSDSFDGYVDAARETPLFPNIESIKKIFRKNIAYIISEKLPQVQERNIEIKEYLIDRFPHLNDYFDDESIGYASQDNILEKAQEKFFKAQKEILTAEQLDDEQYSESLELSSRALTEYILFRQIIINKLKAIDKKDPESCIHNLIIPKKRRLSKDDLENDLYNNGVWVLDDKYMTYNTALSDEEMSEVVNVITDGETTEGGKGRPDISLIFSEDPRQEDKKVDVVIVEFKKKGLSAEENSIVEVQLKNRARKLMKYYGNRIQRMWFYGIVEISEDYKYHLFDENYNELYSNGKLFYKFTEVTLEISPLVKVPMGIFIMDIDAVVKDADARNSTFLNIIKSKFKA